MLPGCGKKLSNLSAGSPFEVQKCSLQFVNDVKPSLNLLCPVVCSNPVALADLICLIVPVT